MSNRTIFLCLLIFSLNSINSVLIYAFRRSLTKYFKAQCSKKIRRALSATMRAEWPKLRNEFCLRSRTSFRRQRVAAEADPRLGYYGELRARYREVLRVEVRRTVDTEAEADEELYELLRMLTEGEGRGFMGKPLASAAPVCA